MVNPILRLNRNNIIDLSIEVKGQWHKDIWVAMNNQLGGLYLQDYQSQGQGIYLVFWFGEDTTKPLNSKAYKDYFRTSDISEMSSTAKELKVMLENCIADQYKSGVEVVVIDVSHS